MEALQKRLQEVRDNLDKKFQKEGLTNEQIEIRFNTIDNDFFRGLWVNGKDPQDGTEKDRLDFYIEFLELELKESTK
jgi:hypothetical protein